MWVIMELTRQMWNNWYNRIRTKKQPVQPIYGLYFSSKTGVTVKTSFQNENKCREMLLKGDWK